MRANDFGSYIKRIYTDREFDICFSGFSNLLDPSDVVTKVYCSKNIIKGVPFSTISYYRNPKVDALPKAAAIEPDPAPRVAEWMEFQQIVMHDVPAINVGVPNWITIHNNRIQSHSVTANGSEGNLAHAYIANCSIILNTLQNMAEIHWTTMAMAMAMGQK